MKENNFLPENYNVPATSGGYMKLAKGENIIRIMSNAITGFEYWNDDTKPVRSREMFKETPNIKCDADGTPSKVKHFWAFVVYNYATESIEILQINQATIQTAISALVKDTDWGNPKNYDIKITKSGEGLKTEYAVNPKPAKEVSPEVMAKFNENPINLEALYNGGNPFEKVASDDNFPEF